MVAEVPIQVLVDLGILLGSRGVLVARIVEVGGFASLEFFQQFILGGARKVVRYCFSTSARDCKRWSA